MRFEASKNFSQLAPAQGGKTFYAGVAEPDKPGSIAILRNPWEKLYEVQAHC